MGRCWAAKMLLGVHAVLFHGHVVHAVSRTAAHGLLGGGGGAGGTVQSLEHGREHKKVGPASGRARGMPHARARARRHVRGLLREPHVEQASHSHMQLTALARQLGLCTLAPARTPAHAPPARSVRHRLLPLHTPPAAACSPGLRLP